MDLLKKFLAENREVFLSFLEHNGVDEDDCNQYVEEILRELAKIKFGNSLGDNFI